jgi:hypothetical protein
LVVTPEGNPEIETCTPEEKPFFGVTEMLTGELVLPCVMVTDADERASEKPGAGGGGC